uniref:Uncharacterized protein n=1 Tax=Anguilla anguilla TaxID=7936 RepID=A0A0E9W1Z5_ANGAN
MIVHWWRIAQSIPYITSKLTGRRMLFTDQYLGLSYQGRISWFAMSC